APADEAEIVEELAQHMDDRYRDQLARGVPELEAQRAALAEIASRQPLAQAMVERVNTQVPAPPIGGPPRRLLAGLLQDVRYAVRLLRRSPTFTIAVVVTIALSTGPTIGALGLVNWLFVRPLPGAADSSRLATVVLGRWRDSGSYSPRRLPPVEIQRFRNELQKSRGFAGCETGGVTVAAGTVDPRVAPAEFVSANFFAALGVHL